MTPEFPALLKTYRERAGLSQVRLAQRAGIDRSYLNRLESGHRLPSRRTVLRLADALGLDPTERDQFLLAGGLAPTVSPLAHTVGDPVLEQAARLLLDATVPASVREDLRLLVAAALRLAQQAAAASADDHNPLRDVRQESEV